MAKRQHWTIDAVAGTMTRDYDGIIDKLEIKIIDLFPLWGEYDGAQKGTIANGLKQKIDDSIAVPKDKPLSEKEKFETQRDLWNQLSVDRLWKAKSESGKAKTPAVKVSELETSIIPMVEAGLTPDKIAMFLKLDLGKVTAIAESHKALKKANKK